MKHNADAGGTGLVSEQGKSRDSQRVGTRRGFPTSKQSAGLFCLPSCAFLQRKNFALCAGRPKALPLDSTTFEKVDETLNVG